MIWVVRLLALVKLTSAFCYWPTCLLFGRYPLERLYDGRRVWYCFFHRPLVRTKQRQEFKRVCREGAKHVY